MKKQTSIWTIAAVSGVIWFTLGIVSKINTNRSYTPTEQSVNNTARNAFVSGCKGEGLVTEQQCGCMYDKLQNMYPDLTTNQARLKRIMDTGYNSEETDFIITCVTDQVGESI